MITSFAAAARGKRPIMKLTIFSSLDESPSIERHARELSRR
jgi:hypothetical protein